MNDAYRIKFGCYEHYGRWSKDRVPRDNKKTMLSEMGKRTMSGQDDTVLDYRLHLVNFRKWSEVAQRYNVQYVQYVQYVPVLVMRRE